MDDTAKPATEAGMMEHGHTSIKLSELAALREEAAGLKERVRELEEELDGFRRAEEINEHRRTLRYTGPHRPILYTDTIEGEQTCVDNLWAITTEQLNKLVDAESRLARLAAKMEDVEGIAKMIYHHIHGDELNESAVYGMRNKMINLARAVSAWLKEG